MRNCFPKSATHLGQDFLLKHIMLKVADESVTNGKIEQGFSSFEKWGCDFLKKAAPRAFYEE
jgi:hypothetical protein